MWSLFFPSSISWRVKIALLPWQKNLPNTHSQVGSWCIESAKWHVETKWSSYATSSFGLITWLLVQHKWEMWDEKPYLQFLEGHFWAKSPGCVGNFEKELGWCASSTHLQMAGFCHCRINKKQWGAHSCHYPFSAEAHLMEKAQQKPLRCKETVVKQTYYISSFNVILELKAYFTWTFFGYSAANRPNCQSS